MTACSLMFAQLWLVLPRLFDFCLTLNQTYFDFLSLLLIFVLNYFYLQVNPDYEDTFIFENDFPALQPDAPDPGEFQFI